MANAGQAALAANERAARAIEAIADSLPTAPAAPAPPALADAAREDEGFGDYLLNDLGGDLKGAFGNDLGIGDPRSKTYQEGQAFYSRPVPKLAVNLLGPTKFKLGGQAVLGGARAIPRVADDAAKAAVGAAAATAAALGGIVYAQRKRSAERRKEWEEHYGKPWPKTEDGRNYDGDHDVPLGDGGEEHPTNVTPRSRQDHVDRHKSRGDYSRWGKRRGR